MAKKAKKKSKPILSKEGIKQAKIALSDIFKDNKTYGYDLQEDLKKSGHYLDTIESIIQKPIRTKIKRINDLQFSIHLINKEFILCTKKGKLPGQWVFNYGNFSRDTRDMHPDIKYCLALEDDFIEPLHKFKHLLGKYDVDYSYSDDPRYYREQASMGGQLNTLWKVLSKKERKPFLKDSKVIALNLR